MTIYPALISHQSDQHPACESLSASLARMSEICPQTWVQQVRSPLEEQLPRPSLWQRARRGLLQRLLGAGNEADIQLPLATRQSSLLQSLAQADILHLHALKGDTISLATLAQLEQPIICDASDDFALSALCTRSGTCTQYLYQCRQCPLYRAHKRVEKIFKFKQKQIQAIRQLVLIAPSRLRLHELQRAPMLKGRKVRHIGIGVNCERLKAQSRIKCKSERDIAPHQRVLAFRCREYKHRAAAQGAQELSIIQQICKALHESGYLSLHILLLGRNEVPALPYPCQCSSVPEHNAASRASLYSSIDILVHLSTQLEDERHALEAMACELPIITHRRGNMSEYVEHQHRGFSLCGKLELHVDELTERIKQLLHAPVLRAHYGLHARQYIEQEHEAGFIAQLYQQLYQELHAEHLSHTNRGATATGGTNGA